MVSRASLHHIRLFYAAYFAAMGIVLPFFPVYLEHLGLGAVLIGMMTGLLAAAKVIAPPWIGHLLGGSAVSWTRAFVVAGAMLAAVLAALMGVITSPWLLAFVVFVFGLLWAAILPLTDGLSISVSEAAIADYGQLRLWGSIGFIFASWAGGIWLVDAHLAAFPWWLAGLLIMTGVAARGFPSAPTEAGGDKPGSGRRFPLSLLTLLLISFIMQASHGAYYGFFSLYLADSGYLGWQIGGLWIIGVMAEILLMWRWSRALQQMDPARVFTACLLLAAVRWMGTGMTTRWWLLCLLQLLHAATFAAFHVTAVAWVKRWAPATRHAAAQGWYSASGFGLGSTLGIMGSGVLVAGAGYPAAFFTCALVAFAGLPLVWRLRWSG